VGRFFDPNFFPNFGLTEPKFFGPLEIKETDFSFKFQDPNPKIGAWGDDRINKKFAFFDEGHISKQFTVKDSEHTQIFRIAFC